MSRKSGSRLSEKIMPKQRDEITIRFRQSDRDLRVGCLAAISARVRDGVTKPRRRGQHRPPSSRWPWTALFLFGGAET
jgi:hypothetical protein